MYIYICIYTYIYIHVCIWSPPKPPEPIFLIWFSFAGVDHISIPNI